MMRFRFGLRNAGAIEDNASDMIKGFCVYGDLTASKTFTAIKPHPWDNHPRLNR